MKLWLPELQRIDANDTEELFRPYIDPPVVDYHLQLTRADKARLESTGRLSEF